MQPFRHPFTRFVLPVLHVVLFKPCVCHVNFTTDLADYHGYLRFQQTATASAIDVLFSKFPDGEQLRVFLTGDSLTRQQTSWLLTTLQAMEDREQQQGLLDLTSYQDTNFAFDSDKMRLQHVPLPCGFFNTTDCKSCDFDRFLGALTESKPTVVVFNLALHLMHLVPARRFGCLGQNLYLEQGMDAFLRHLKDAFDPAPALVFMTSNSMCENWLVRDYGRVHARWDAGDPQVMEDCVAQSRGVLERQIAAGIIPGDHVSDERLSEACKLSYFSDDAVRHLNERATGAVNQAAEWYPGPLRILNGYEITHNQCWATLDGRHYPPLAVVQATRLLHLMMELV